MKQETSDNATVTSLSNEDIAAIKALGPALDKAAVSGDWNALTALFTEDAMLMGPNSPTVKGRANLMDSLESSGMTVSKHKVEYTEVDGYGDIAYGVCSWTEKSSVEGADPIEENGKILGILRRQSNGTWRIARWSWNSDFAAPDVVVQTGSSG
jgi:ketosteroid isomerase-like protein